MHSYARSSRPLARPISRFLVSRKTRKETKATRGCHETNCDLKFQDGSRPLPPLTGERAWSLSLAFAHSVDARKSVACRPRGVEGRGDTHPPGGEEAPKGRGRSTQREAQTHLQAVLALDLDPREALRLRPRLLVKVLELLDAHLVHVHAGRVGRGVAWRVCT